MKWWSFLIIAVLLGALVWFIYGKVDDSRTINSLNELKSNLESDARRTAQQLELLRAEVDQGNELVGELRKENKNLRRELDRSAERSAILEAIITDSESVTRALGGEVEEASSLVQQVLDRIRVDRERIRASER